MTSEVTLDPFSESLHAEKYRSKGETFRDWANRVASGLKDNDSHYKALREILIHQRFLPAGRIQAAIGSPRGITPYNCFVSGTIVDSFTSGHGCIMDRAREAAETMRMGGGIGYDFSTLRPRGSLIRKLGSTSSGAVSFMDIFNSVCLCTQSSGHRRGAQMGVLRVDHPDVEEFIVAKHNSFELTGFNLSLSITDEFMQALEDGTSFKLRFNGEVIREVDPVPLWETIMRSTWDWAEPGVIFIDRVNEMNNLYYCEDISATNPCGEQPLPPYGACLLGSFNLAAYLVHGGVDGTYDLDLGQLLADIPHVVRAMDNVVDIAKYPLHEQEAEAQSKRRMGLGVTGVANAIEAFRPGQIPYGSKSFCEQLGSIFETIKLECYRSSVELAKEKGAFPKFDAKKYIESKFLSTFPPELVKDIKRFGIRNSHLTSIAPTGTISLCANNISSGIEPVYQLRAKRTVNRTTGIEVVDVEDYGLKHLNHEGKTADQISAPEHLDVLSTAAKHIDSAVSKTCNVPSDMPWNNFKELYFEAWRRGCKGITTFQVGGKRSGVFATPEDDAQPTEGDSACYIDPETGQRECE